MSIDAQGRYQWQADPTPAFVVAVADVEWFRRTMAKALFSGRIRVLYAVPDEDRRGLRSEIRGAKR